MPSLIFVTPDNLNVVLASTGRYTRNGRLLAVTFEIDTSTIYMHNIFWNYKEYGTALRSKIQQHFITVHLVRSEVLQKLIILNSHLELLMEQFTLA